MGKRRKAREIVLQALYEAEFSDKPLKDIFDEQEISSKVMRPAQRGASLCLRPSAGRLCEFLYNKRVSSLNCPITRAVDPFNGIMVGLNLSMAGPLTRTHKSSGVAQG